MVVALDAKRMKIETKYDVGQNVWWASPDGPVLCEITMIVAGADGIGPWVDYEIKDEDDHWVDVDEAFLCPTEAEAQAECPALNSIQGDQNPCLDGPGCEAVMLKWLKGEK